MIWLAHRTGAAASTASLLRVRRSTVILFFCFLVMAVLGGVFHLSEQYQSTVDEAKRVARASVRTAESYTSRTAAEAYRVLEGLADVYHDQATLGRFDERSMHLILAEKLKKLPAITTLFLLNADKTIIATNRAFPAEQGRLDEFNKAIANPTDLGNGLFIGSLYASGKHTAGSERFYLPLGVKVIVDDKLASYVIAVIRTEDMSRFFDTLDLGKSGMIGLWRDDSTLIAASRNSAMAPGETHPEFTKYFQEPIAQSDGAGESIYSITNGYNPRIRAVDKLADLPLVVLVTLEGQDFLSKWHDSRNRVGIAILGLILVMVATGFFIVGQFKRSEENEVALRHAKASAEEANAAKSRFLAHMSHEFRTPLNAIMGFSEIIKGKVLGDGVSPVYISYAGHIHKSGEHLLNIVNDVLDMAKVESGTQALRRENVSIARSIENAVAFVERLASERGVNIVLALPDAMPDVIADERFLRQVLINLLTNAAKFSDPGSDIMVRTRHHAKGLDIAIEDKGPGIEAAIMQRIGEPFLQSNPSLSRSGQGAGLGLSICKQYMDLLGGELLINSTPNQGTTAAVRFPPALLTEPEVQIAKAAE